MLDFLCIRGIIIIVPSRTAQAELDKLLKTGLIQGKNPRELAVHLQKRFGASREDAERLMVTELARVQTEAQKLSLIHI